jgi:hypothetical protein
MMSLSELAKGQGIEKLSEDELFAIWEEIGETAELVKLAKSALLGLMVRRYEVDQDRFGKTEVTTGAGVVTFEVPRNEKWDQDGLQSLANELGQFMKVDLSFPAASLKLLSAEDKARVLAYRHDKPGTVKMTLKRG